MAAPTPPTSREAYQILSPRLVIRTAVAADAESLHKLMTTPENFPHGGCNTKPTVDEFQARIGRWHAMQREGLNAFLVVALRDTGELVGQASYNLFEPLPSTAAADNDGDGDGDGAAAAPPARLLVDIGLVLDRGHWRRGLGAEVVCTLVEFAARDLGCAAFRAETDAANEPWRALMRSLGLEAFETFGAQSVDETGWVWMFDAEDWGRVRAGLKEKGKWPLE